MADDCEWKPNVGMEFDSEQEAFQFYNEYGRRTGFSIRKDSSNKNKHTGVLISRRFVCSSEGIREKKKNAQSPINPKVQTRTGCEAQMSIKLNKKKNKYEVKIFVEKHNHTLVPVSCSYMLSSQRRISALQIAEMELTKQSSIPLRSAHELLSRQDEGKECPDFLKLDQKNYLRGRRQTNLAYGEAGSLLKFFRDQTVKNPLFFYAVQLDSDEQIANIFWADAMMIIDYGHFGDVVTFDTTYKINNAHCPFVIFVGLNHHRESVVFGAALMYDETVDSFTWLFETFLEAMSNKAPRTIITDLDAAMTKAIPQAMPDTFHMLCKWHIMQNVMKHVSNIGTKSGKVKDMLAYVMDNVDDEDDFLTVWENMLDQYEVRENNWLKTIFAVKEKWANAYIRNAWSAGMQNTELCESYNFVLKQYLKADHDLVQFLLHFERVLVDKRHKELEAEYALCRKLPKVKMSLRILVQGRKIYTNAIFEKFQAEFEKSIELLIKDRVLVDDGHVMYTIGNYNDQRVRYVKADTTNISVSCSCKRFERKGFLCSHALKILKDEMQQIEIPSQYILKRWTRDARSTNVQDMHGRDIEADVRLQETQRYRALCSKFLRILARAAESEETYRIAKNTVNELQNNIEAILHLQLGGEEQDKDDHTSSSVSRDTTLDDVNTVQAKGFEKMVDHFSRQKRKEKSVMEIVLSSRKKSSKKDEAQTTTQDVYSFLPPQPSQPSQVPPNMHHLDGTSFYPPMPLPPVPWTQYAFPPNHNFQALLQQNNQDSQASNSPACTQALNMSGSWHTPSQNNDSDNAF